MGSTARMFMQCVWLYIYDTPPRAAASARPPFDLQRFDPSHNTCRKDLRYKDMESHPLPTQKTVPAEKTKTPKAGKPGNSRLTKLAEQIAGKLEKEIISMGWPVGYPLGREADLVERFGANRWAVREALAITERDGLTEMRRGRNGGIFIAAPAESLVATTMRNYLLFSP